MARDNEKGLEDCPACERSISENATICPRCGEPLAPGWAEEIRRAERERKKTRKRGRRIWASVLVALIILPFVLIETDQERLQDLKISDPTAYELEIKALESAVAKVPATNIEENLRQYRFLATLEPDNERYQDKIEHYEAARQARNEANQLAAAHAVRERDQRVQAAAEEERRKGFHCLSGWDGAHPEFKRLVKEQLRDPDSFEEVETRITSVNSSGYHNIFMTYRARNGYGGYNVEQATGVFRSSDCAIRVTALQ